jgi:hypothetical protein
METLEQPPSSVNNEKPHKMKSILILITSMILVCAGGCIAERHIEISVPLTTSGSGEFTSATAEQLFRKVATQFGLEVQRPILQQANYGVLSTFTAISMLSSSTNSPAPGWLVVYIAPHDATFQCNSSHYFEEAQKMASQFEEALDKQGIRYTVTKQTASPFNN